MKTLFPVRVTFRDMGSSLRLAELIRDRSADLARYCDRIGDVRVVMSKVHRRRESVRPFRVRIDVGVPGGKICVGGTESHVKQEHRDPFIAVRDAFEVAVRRIEDRRLIRRRPRGGRSP
jgi:ribosome-associated translation inhibitor RaiA